MPLIDPQWAISAGDSGRSAHFQASQLIQDVATISPWAPKFKFKWNGGKIYQYLHEEGTENQS